MTKDPAWAREAASRQAGIASQATNTHTHDVGFQFVTTFVQGYRLTHDRSYLRTALVAARSLATRYNAKVRAIKSLDGQPGFNVIIDSMMNLELLFWAADHGAPRLRALAVNHALTVRANNVRPDGSTYQMVVFNPATGRVRSKSTIQGLSAKSTWSRGQAWGIAGFATAYRETRDARFLGTARRLADYFLAHLPADHVPLWDFNAPAGDPKDSSAAAIAASGLIELAKLDPEASRRAHYLAEGQKILDALSSPDYRSSATGPPSILLHGTQNKRKGIVDVGLVYGDYYYLQALARRAALAPPSTTSPPPPRNPRRSAQR